MSRLVTSALALAVSVSCAAPRDEAPAVASGSVVLSTQDAAVGSPLEMRYRWEAVGGASMPRDPYVVFVHAVDASGTQIWTDDHQPPVPVDQWKAGTPVEYVRTMFVPKTATNGRIEFRVGLYDPKTGARLRLTGEATGDTRAYPLAMLDVKPDPEAAFVAFTEGWHNPESSQALGREWRWSKRSGRLAFRHPKRQAELWLELDQPVAEVASPQQVQLIVAGTVVDTFMLDGQAITVHRTALAPDVLGAADTVELDIVPAQSFVPADVPSLKNADRRELGVRIFNAYLALR